MSDRFRNCKNYILKESKVSQDISFVEEIFEKNTCIWESDICPVFCHRYSQVRFNHLLSYHINIKV